MIILREGDLVKGPSQSVYIVEEDTMVDGIAPQALLRPIVKFEGGFAEKKKAHLNNFVKVYDIQTQQVCNQPLD